MENNLFIACCGLDCEKCEARIATVKNDDEMRQKVADEWSELNGITISKEDINCVGCRIDGVKSPFCDHLCPIRQCVLGKEIGTCGQCEDLHSCQKIKMIITNNEEALKRLESK